MGMPTPPAIAVEEERRKSSENFLPIGKQAIEVDDSGQEGADEARVVEEIESLCMNCQENGTTKLLLTKIPFFREVILMSFECDSCHFKNTEVKAAGEIQEQGTKHVLMLDRPSDLQRQIVKSDVAVFRVEDIDLEVPSGRGKFTTIEGILTEVMRDLQANQAQRAEQSEAVHAKVAEIVLKLAEYATGDTLPFSISLDDPSGNSWIEISTEDGHGKLSRSHYRRTPQQNAALGLPVADETTEEGKINLDDVDIMDGQLYTLPCECPGCGRPAEANMQLVNIPFFKQVVISVVSCGACGYRTSEVKTGGEIPSKGKMIWLDVKNERDLSRDILKSETCCLKLPVCGIEVQPGTMGGRFTTVEGILSQIRDDLRRSVFDLEGSDEAGDSASQGSVQAWQKVFADLDKAIKAELEYTILLEDPLANSYVQSFTAPEPDPQIRAEDYTRTSEEEDDLGLSDMRTHLNEHGEYVKEPNSKESSN